MEAAPVDGDVFPNPIESAFKEGITMIVFNTAFKRHDKVESFVVTNNYQGGVLCDKKRAELFGGKGSALDTGMRAFILQVLRSGCVMLGVPSHVQGMIVGTIIVGVTTVDRL